MSAHFELACNEVLNSFVFIIEGNIEAPQMNKIEIHLSQCPACESELTHEQSLRSLMQETLRRTCNEQAPEELHASIFRQIHENTTGTFTEIHTQYSMTEISIEIDEYGQIEHHEVRIEHSEEIVVLNNPIDPDSLDGQGK
jgi:mycothiol system anti-sigma-R factor